MTVMQRLQPCVNQNSVSVNSVNHEQGDGHLPCDALQCLCVLRSTRTLGCAREELLFFVLVCRSSCKKCNLCARNLYM